jgi:hypothetical protein
MITTLSKRRNESGVALLIAMFALLLLSAIGMGMMFSANTETNVNANYREKQLAVYAALGGAMEAKDRLTSAGDIPVPGGTPSPSAANVIYIINPSGGETVAPWDYTNKYYDTELCHENVLGLTTSGNGVHCPAAATSFPSGSSWYSTLDNSSSGYTGAFKLSTPLSYKWTRIQLKANNSTSYPVDGNPAHTNQVCWNGISQIPLPAGYSSACIPNGGINSVTVTANGTNYYNPIVTIGAPPSGGTQATATAQLCGPTGCPVGGLVLDVAGTGYTSAPTVTIGAPEIGSDTATVTATYIGPGAAIASVTQGNIGSPTTACWSDANLASANWNGGKVYFTGNGGSGAYATLNTVTSPAYNCISALSFTGGNCVTKGAGGTVSISSGGMTGSVIVPNSTKLNGAGASVAQPGSGFSSAATPLTINSGITVLDSGGNTCTSVTASAVLGHTLRAVSSGVTFNTANGGAGYTSNTPASTTSTPAPSSALSVTPAAGSLPTITGIIGSGGSATGHISIALTHAGSGYTSAPTVTITGGCGAGSPPPACTTNATAHTVVSGVVTGITITNAGSGYTSPPTVTISDHGPGSGATATAQISGGTYYSSVYLITSLGISPAGARNLVQIEAAPAIRAIAMPGALTLAGPQPTFGAPNSNNFMINGVDNVSGGAGTAPTPAGCSSTPNPPHPSIGVYDNPNSPTTPSSAADVLAAIPSGRIATNYPGLNASPDVQNVYGALGDQGTTPSGMDSIVSAISALPGANVYSGNQTDSSINIGSSNGASPPVITSAIDVVNGDLTFNGNNKGYGILVVTGNLIFKGNFTWNGLVLLIGQGSASFSGGGAGTINGSVLIAKTKDATGHELAQLGMPTLDWSGGGGNGIYYDHCYADAYLNMIPMTVPASAKPLTILSIKTLSY